jgi:hypothetical protein
MRLWNRPTTARQHIDGIEGEYGRHGFTDDYDEKNRPEQWDFDVAENRPSATSIDLGRLIILIGDQLEPRQEEDGYQGPFFPYEGHDQADLGQGGVGQEGDIAVYEPQGVEQPIEDPEIGV